MLDHEFIAKIEDLMQSQPKQADATKHGNIASALGSVLQSHIQANAPQPPAGNA